MKGIATKGGFFTGAGRMNRAAGAAGENYSMTFGTMKS